MGRATFEGDGSPERRSHHERVLDLQLDELVVDDANEEGAFSDGDESFVAAIGFRSRIGTPGSTQVWWNGMLDDDWGDHARDGSHRTIPADMGLLRFDGVERPLLTPSSTPERLGRVTIVVESDATPFGTMSRSVEDGGDLSGDPVAVS